MIPISTQTMKALIGDAMNRSFENVACGLEEKGADRKTAEVCAARAIELGLDYGISDLPSLIGIGILLGTYDAEFDKVPSVLATLTSNRIKPHERVSRIINSSALLARIRSNSPSGHSRVLRSDSKLNS